MSRLRERESLRSLLKPLPLSIQIPPSIIYIVNNSPQYKCISMNQTQLTTCHAQLAPLLGPTAEPIAVTKLVEQHRWFWRPARPRLLLLAESHVYTTEAETQSSMVASGIPAGIPKEFVRLVYCLGYGEKAILNRSISSANTGTPQFWKIFKHCLAPENEATNSEEPASPANRLANKLRILHRLKEQGIWLLDASIAALYQPGVPKLNAQLRHTVISTSWDNYVQHVVSQANPQAILCIGIGVARTLSSRLDNLKIPWDAVPQPQARLSSAEHTQISQTYHAVAQDPAKIRNIARHWLTKRPPLAREAASGSV